MKKTIDRTARITDVSAREILDSRGDPTVEAEVTAENGKYTGRASVPSGASTGANEAAELRDGGERWGGRGVRRAVSHVNGELGAALVGMNVFDQGALDRAMIEADGTENKSRLGANAILAVSMACARCAAKAAELPLWLYIGGPRARMLPAPMMNILNGGVHASNTLDVQEFMIVPAGAASFPEAMEWGVRVYRTLRARLVKSGLATAVGDEGGFAPDFPDENAALAYLTDTIEAAKLRPGRDVLLALDAASSEWWEDGGYHLPKSGRRYTPEKLCSHWEKLCAAYPIASLEDPLGEHDEAGWKLLTERLGKRCLLVGDDLFTTDPARLAAGQEAGTGNAILIKPNQIGTLLETVAAVELAKKRGWAFVLSHRSGETEDAFLADLAVGLGAPLIKSGAPCRGERTTKYNRLLRIAEELRPAARYAGMTAFSRGK